VGAVVVSTATRSDTANPLPTSPLTVASWPAAPSSPKTLSLVRLTRVRLLAEPS
jgi:hypothetical protein